MERPYMSADALSLYWSLFLGLHNTILCLETYIDMKHNIS